MVRKYSEQTTLPGSHRIPGKRDPLVFVIASDRDFLHSVLSRCADLPSQYSYRASLEELAGALARIERVDVVFAVIVERSADTIDPLELRHCKLAFPQLSYVLLVEHCDQGTMMRFQSMGVHNVILPPFSSVRLAGEIAGALPNVPQFKRHPGLMRRGQIRLDFVIPSDLRYILGVNHLISLLLREFSFSVADSRINIPLACDEALTNAILHGNRSDDEKVVTIQIYMSSSRIKLRIRDQGQGFDVNRVADPTATENLLRAGGRGIYLMRSIMDRVEYKEGGRVVELEKEVGP